MSLTINHNLMAVNAARNLTAAFGSLQTSIQRLSSGLRVNSAADDAAGMAIRELMRSDIAAMVQGVRKRQRRHLPHPDPPTARPRSSTKNSSA